MDLRRGVNHRATNKFERSKRQIFVSRLLLLTRLGKERPDIPAESWDALTGKRKARKTPSWLQQFAVRLMVAIPSDQSLVGCVVKKKFEFRRIDVPVTIHHIGLGLMA
jgi:hypothetical protein